MEQRKTVAAIIFILAIIGLIWWLATHQGEATPTTPDAAMEEAMETPEEAEGTSAGDYTETTYECTDGAALSLFTKEGAYDALSFSFTDKDGNTEQETIPAVVAASGSKYEGYGITIWEHQGEVSVTYLDTTYTCTPQA